MASPNTSDSHHGATSASGSGREGAQAPPFPSPPGSNLVSRLQAFLPVLAAANTNLTDLSPIDADLMPQAPDGANEASDSDDDADGEEEGPEGSEAQPQVQLQFALGDFDSSVVAGLEEEKEEGAQPGGESASSADSPKEIVLPGISSMARGGAKRPREGEGGNVMKKPLIKEL